MDSWIPFINCAINIRPNKADLVALIVDNGGAYCGIAYVMANGPRASFANYAFSVTDRDCVANNTLTHELGHNMGNAHDRASGGTGVFAYSYGYRDTIGKFRTIMAYPCPTGSCPRGEIRSMMLTNRMTI